MIQLYKNSMAEICVACQWVERF